MLSESRTCLDKLAVLTRYLLIGVLAVVLFGGLGSGEPPGFYSPSRVYAAGGVSTNFDLASLTLRADKDSKFYIIDSNQRKILVYAFVNDCLRLVSARAFDFDSNIADASIPAPKPLEGVKGVTRAIAEQYSINIAPTILELEKKKPK